MFPRLLPATAVLAIIALAVSALAIGLMPHEPRLWGAAIALVTLGTLTPMIFAVNVRIVPVFSRRAWRSSRPLAAALISANAGAWFVFAGRATGTTTVELFGAALALGGGVLFVASLAMLFRSPVTAPMGPPLPYPNHAAIDRIATRFTRLGGVYLLLGLLTGVLLIVWTPTHGRWELVWAHALLLGWLLHMAAGVLYHVLARWTDRRWRHPRLIALHWRLTALGLPLMLVALMLDSRWLFAVGGTLQATALLIFVWHALPLVQGLPMVSRVALSAALVLLGCGVLLGASFALDPVNHVRLRFSHGVINLLGFAGLLISGAGYYLFPRFAGQALRWPRLAAVQVALQLSGVLVLAGALWWYMRGGVHAKALILYGGVATGLGVALFAIVIGATFARRAHGATVTTLRVSPPRHGPARS
jgi:hypothetical protein